MTTSVYHQPHQQPQPQPQPIDEETLRAIEELGIAAAAEADRLQLEAGRLRREAAELTNRANTLEEEAVRARMVATRRFALVRHARQGVYPSGQDEHLARHAAAQRPGYEQPEERTNPYFVPAYPQRLEEPSPGYPNQADGAHGPDGAHSDAEPGDEPGECE